MTRRYGVIHSGDGISNTGPLFTPKQLRTCCSNARVSFLSPSKVGASSTLSFNSKISMSCLRSFTRTRSRGTRVCLRASGVVCTPRYLGTWLPLTKRHQRYRSFHLRSRTLCNLYTDYQSRQTGRCVSHEPSSGPFWPLLKTASSLRLPKSLGWYRVLPSGNTSI